VRHWRLAAAASVRAFALPGRPKLGACLEIAEWRGGNAGLEKELFEQLIASPQPAVMKPSRPFASGASQDPFLGYGYRVSFTYIAAGFCPT